MIPIHVAEIKKLIVKDQIVTDPKLNEDHLLNVLTSNSCGRNPTFFKAFGHSEVFGLKSSIPEGGTIAEIVENVVVETTNGSTENRQEGVLYVHLPEGHPVITGSAPSDEESAAVRIDTGQEVGNQVEEPNLDPLNMEAEVIIGSHEPSPAPMEIPVTSAPVTSSPIIPTPVTSSSPTGLRRSTRPSAPPNTGFAITTSDDPEESSSSKHRYNTRPQRANRHFHALKQQAKRRQKNKNVAAGIALPQRTLARRSTNSSNGEIDIAFRPFPEELEKSPQSMKEVLTSVPGFNHRKLKLKGPYTNKKFTNAQMIQQAKEMTINLETPDSILSVVNLRTLLNKSTFSKLPPLYQFKLMQLLPQVDLLFEEKKGLRLNSSAFNNEFFAKACHEWRERLLKGDFTAEAVVMREKDMAFDKKRLDPWKLKHYEPLWGMKRVYDLSKPMDRLVPCENQTSLTRRSGRNTRSAASTPKASEEPKMPVRESARMRTREAALLEDPVIRKESPAPSKIPPEQTAVTVVNVPEPLVCDTEVTSLGDKRKVEEKDEEVKKKSDVQEKIVETKVIDEPSIPPDSPEPSISPRRDTPKRSPQKSPRVTISDDTEEITDIADEPVIKKRRIEFSDEVSKEPETASKDMIIKSFNDPILELDSKYDLSPEETLPENFLELVEDDEDMGETDKDLEVMAEVDLDMPDAKFKEKPRTVSCDLDVNPDMVLELAREHDEVARNQEAVKMSQEVNTLNEVEKSVKVHKDVTDAAESSSCLFLEAKIQTPEASSEDKSDKDVKLNTIDKEQALSMEEEDIDFVAEEEEKMEVDDEKMEVEDEKEEACDQKLVKLHMEEEETGTESVSLRKTSVSSEDTSGSTTEEHRDETEKTEEDMCEMPKSDDHTEPTLFYNRDEANSSPEPDEASINDESSVSDKAENEGLDENNINDNSSEEDSELAPVLIQEEPPKSVDSNVASIDTAPPTLSPNERRSSKDSQEDFSMEEYEQEEKSQSEESESEDEVRDDSGRGMQYESEAEMAGEEEEGNSLSEGTKDDDDEEEEDDRDSLVSGSPSPAPPTLSPEPAILSPVREDEMAEDSQENEEGQEEEDGEDIDEGEEEEDDVEEVGSQEEEEEEEQDQDQMQEEPDEEDMDSASHTLLLEDIDPSILPVDILNTTPRKDAVSKIWHFERLSLFPQKSCS